MVCPAYNFETPSGKAYVAGSYLGEVPKIDCPPNSFYNGPVVECGWVNQFCLGTHGQNVSTGPCWNQYSFTLKGQSLHKWPEGVAPRIVYIPPPSTIGTNFIKTSKGAAAINAVGGNNKTPFLPIIISPDHLTCGDENYVDLNFERAVAHDKIEPDEKEQPWFVRYGRVD